MDSSVTRYKSRERKRDPLEWLDCLLRFKWRNKTVLEGSLSIFNHLSITLGMRVHLFDPVFFFFYVSVRAAACMFHSSWHIQLGHTHTEELLIYTCTYCPYVSVHGSTGHANQGMKTYIQSADLLSTLAAHTLRAWMTFQGDITALNSTLSTTPHASPLIPLWHLGALVWQILGICNVYHPGLLTADTLIF